jgi:hypothetical protein
MKKISFFATFMCVIFMSYGQVYLAQDFSGGTMPPTDWTIDGLPAQWSINGGNEAGGTAPEAMFTWVNSVSTTRLISPVVDLSGLASVKLAFSHFYDDYTGTGPLLGAAIRYGGGNWVSIWEINPVANVGPEMVIIDLLDFNHSDFQFCFYLDGNMYNIDYWFVDDILLYNPLALDAELKSIKLPTYVELNGSATLTGTVKNIGSTNINSFDVSYTVGGGAPVVYPVTGLNLALGESYNFTHGTPINFNEIGTFEVVVTVENVNGGEDENPANNTLSKFVGVLPYIPSKKVFAEEATGTWCGWCVRGICFMDYMTETYPETWIGVAVHNGDPMVVPAYDDEIGNIIPQFPGYPSGTLDRAGESFWDPEDFEQGYLERMEALSPASIDIANYTWDPVTRVINFNLQSEFIVDIYSELRFGVVITEDSLWGTTAQWNQANYYAGGGNGPMCGFESMPSVIPAAQMHYDHVAREILDTPYGTENSLPNPILAGSTHSYNYTYTIPQEWNYDKITIIGILIDMTTGEILNANNVIDPYLGIDNLNVDANVGIYPNPFNNLTNIVFSTTKPEMVKVDVYNLLGGLVYSEAAKQYQGGENKIQFSGSNLENGVYFIQLTIGERTYIQKVSVIK